MANVLDLRRRIRSVKNTRQITKAMKMVSAAKLRRAQDRTLKARPYARMLASVLVSMVRRTDCCNEETGDILHPLLVEREEKNVLVVVIAGDKGFAGAFNSNIGKAAQRLFVSQPMMSRRIASLERDIGGALFERTSRQVRLTPLGSQLRRQLQPGYAQMQAAIDDARGAARGMTGQLRVGFTATTPSEPLNRLVKAFGGSGIN